MNNKITSTSRPQVTEKLPNVIFVKIVEAFFNQGAKRSEILELRCLCKNAQVLIDRSCVAFKQLTVKEFVSFITKVYPKIKDQEPSISLKTDDFKILNRNNPPKREMWSRQLVWDNPRSCLGPEVLPIKTEFLECLLKISDSKFDEILCERLKGSKLSELLSSPELKILDNCIPGSLETVNSIGSTKTAIIFTAKLKIKIDDYNTTNVEIVIVKKVNESIGILILPKDLDTEKLKSIEFR